VLLKLVLFSLLVYQCSVLLAPAGVLKIFEGIVCKFFWQGGKQSSNKAVLVSWDKTKKNFLEGGLQIKNIKSQNLTLGAKILWRQISGKATWVKNVLWKIYFKNSRLRSLDEIPKLVNGSPIFRLCSEAHTLSRRSVLGPRK